MSRRKSAGQRFTEAMAIAVITPWPGAAFLMVVLGILHGSVLDAIHPIGYWPSLGLFVMADLAIGMWRQKPNNWED